MATKKKAKMSKTEDKNPHTTLERMLHLINLLTRHYGASMQDIIGKLSEFETKEVSKRSVYRYLASLKNTGFIIHQRDGYYKIDNERSRIDMSNLLHFSEEESYILSQAIEQIDGEQEIKQNLAKKLYSLYDFDQVPMAVTKKENLDSVRKLIKAIEKRRQVVLKNYQSASSETVRDRLVEPIDITNNYTTLWALDSEDKICKVFLTMRFSDVVLKDTRFTLTSAHRKMELDIFRMANLEGKNPVSIQLMLSFRAKTLLVEEYPLAEKYIEEVKSGEKFLLNTKVNGFLGIGRFIMGLPGEVSIISPAKLKDFVRERIQKFMD